MAGHRKRKRSKKRTWEKAPLRHSQAAKKGVRRRKAGMSRAEKRRLNKAAHRRRMAMRK